MKCSVCMKKLKKDYVLLQILTPDPGQGTGSHEVSCRFKLCRPCLWRQGVVGNMAFLYVQKLPVTIHREMA